MKLKTNVARLAKIMVVCGAAYLPQAHADVVTDLGVLTAPSMTDLVNNVIPTGSFTDTYNFSLSAAAIAGTTAGTSTLSYSWTVDSSDPNELGAALTGMTLTGGAVNKTGVLTTSTPVYDPNTTLYGITYTDTISSTALMAGTQYAITVTGIGGTYNGPSGPDVNAPDYYYAPGFYTGTLTLTSPVPEPEEWAMLLLGLPLMGWVARRKQSKNAVVAA